jgi:hypothetical protein
MEKRPNIEKVTSQQEACVKHHEEYREAAIAYGIRPMPFWEFYARWCEEDGLFNDRTCSQFDTE